MSFYSNLSRLFPTREPPNQPQRIVLVLPCCIGDVILATATLAALRRAYPDAHITWAVGSWSKGVIEQHPALNAILDTGDKALPVKSPREFLHFVQQIRAGNYDLVVSLVRSPLMSAALLLSDIPNRAGLDSAGRGFGYNIRVPIDPVQPRHEAEIYLDVSRALGIDTTGCRANVPVRDSDRQKVAALVQPPYIVINPAGGRNPGMVMDAKRYPPENLALLADRLQEYLNAPIVLVAGPKDQSLIDAVQLKRRFPPLATLTNLSFGEIAALAADSLVYIGNDTGLTHLAAAAGAKTVMIMGPSDPVRYAPYADKAIALWKPISVNREGVAAGTPADWDWARDGISVDEVEAAVLRFLETNP